MSFEGVSDVLDHPGVETDSVTLASPTTHHKEAALEATPSQNSDASSVCENSMTSDSSDTRWIGKGIPVQDKYNNRPQAATPVDSHSLEYRMNHKRRGLALIIVYEVYGGSGPLRRKCAQDDVNITVRAFQHLGFEIKEHWNLKEQDLKRILKEVAATDHSQSDALAVIFMSHGGLNEKNNREFIWVYDGKVDTSVLWKNFTAENCPTLAGKPKMFFIQACRGEETDKGIQLNKQKGLRVSTDSFDPREKEDYVIPIHADMLMMWASYPGMFAFNSNNFGVKGSVFIHFLCQVLLENSFHDDLATLLLRVTREVAIKYESYVPDNSTRHSKKQIPYTVSTLMRKVYFFERNKFIV
ncbi:hypothetical protein Pmani_020892 [Petrolisthes manimaculis]|uniref:Uncharacterized protein n=1 Tax=Petrolisthes manimaculis TaxID=1843537 RepID=A0AAE1PFX9_9EUCA|nr:hypothetical protein Pmani_020892 [Petrolisthes manimaculis]